MQESYKEDLISTLTPGTIHKPSVIIPAEMTENDQTQSNEETKIRTSSNMSEFECIDIDKDLKCTAKGCRCNREEKNTVCVQQTNQTRDSMIENVHETKDEVKDVRDDVRDGGNVDSSTFKDESGAHDIGNIDTKKGFVCNIGPAVGHESGKYLTEGVSRNLDENEGINVDSNVPTDTDSKACVSDKERKDNQIIKSKEDFECVIDDESEESMVKESSTFDDSKLDNAKYKTYSDSPKNERFYIDSCEEQSHTIENKENDSMFFGKPCSGNSQGKPQLKRSISNQTDVKYGDVLKRRLSLFQPHKILFDGEMSIGKLFCLLM